MNELKVKLKVGCHRGAVNSRGDRPDDRFVSNLDVCVPSAFRDNSLRFGRSEIPPFKEREEGHPPDRDQSFE